jgi:pimeloyl-ACP methyl ester carboxylesterase
MPLISYLSNSSGAFDPAALQSGAGTPTPVTALVSLPLVANVPACPQGSPVPAGLKCAPLVIFHHGLGATKATMLAVANQLNAKGFVVAAIDAPLHGDRAYCAKNSECNAGGTCTPNAALAQQGDTTPPGTCSNGLAHVPQLCASTACQGAWAGAPYNGQSGQTLASAEYFISANFFRTRDVNRQGVIDNSGLILALSPTTAGAPSSFQQALIAKGYVVSPPSSTNVANVSWVGQSYGSIMGAVNAAGNPRIGAAVLNVGGGTSVDIFSTKGSTFYPRLQTLLRSLGVVFDPVTGDPTPATAGLYLQFLNIAKWILDPSDPINFAGSITDSGKMLPNLLLKQPAQPVKAALGQIAQCDGTVPNPTSFELYLNMGLAPLYAGGLVGTSPATVTTFVNNLTLSGACPGVSSSGAGGVPHGFMTSWGISYDATNTPQYDSTVRSLTQDAQDQGAAFLASGGTTKPSNLQVRP